MWRETDVVKKKSGMRRMLSCLLTVCLLAGMFPSAAFATDSNVVTYPVTGGNIYFNKSTGAVTNCDKSVTEVMIPRKIEGVVVQEIGNCAFRYCYDLENIIIPDSVTIIGEEAFRSCRNLKSIIIPDGVTVIEDYIFSDCNSLNSIYIPDGIVKIGDYAFYGCENLIEAEIPEGVGSIGSYAFNNCGLTDITIPASLKSISAL